MRYTLILATTKKYGEAISHTFSSNYPEDTPNIMYWESCLSKHILADKKTPFGEEWLTEADTWTYDNFLPDNNYFLQKKYIVICDSDKSIHYFSKMGLPVIAASHALNSSENLMGTPWLILSPDALSPAFLEEVYCRHYHLPLIVVTTARCYLREFIMDDFPFLMELQQENISNPEGCFFPADCTVPEEFLSSYIQNQYTFYRYGIFAVIEKETQQFLGIAGFSTVSSESSPALVCYSILKKWQRKGYASEAIAGLKILAREQYHFAEIAACIRPENTASLAVAKKNKLDFI